MGTRGAYGFRINGVDKVTYNHFDSYPEGLGGNVIDFVRETPWQTMKDAATRIVIVSGNSVPPRELQERYKKYSDLYVSNRTLAEWYCLLRKTQGDLAPYTNGLEHMIDGSWFLADSASCEWAYIINVDDETLEVYKGFNKNKEAPGRYAALECEVGSNGGYQGVALLTTFKLDDVPYLSKDDMIETIYKIAYPDEDEENVQNTDKKNEP